MAKTAAAAQHLVELVPLSRIVESPTNPRKTFTEIEDLAEDLKKRGVLQPILLRPAAPAEALNGNLLELVFGARRFRAAKLAGLEAIPAMVRELTAAEALEIQVVENSKRQDVHPMEEAEGFERLRELAPGGDLPVEEIAAKIGKSAAYVYGRMKLLNLCKEGRKLFYEGHLNATSAVFIARVPEQTVQREILKDLARYGDDWSTGLVSQAVQRHLLRLADAPFPKDDPALTDAGPCSICPKRSGAQPALFSDVDKRDDLCTDPACYRAKTEAAWERRRAEAEAKGLKVLDGKAGEKACGYGSEYVKLEEHNYNDPKHRTWKQLVGKAAKDQVVLARDERGQVHELVPKKETGKLLKQAGHNLKADRAEVRGSGSRPSKAETEKAKQARELDEAVDRRVVELVVAAFEKGEGLSLLWAPAARMALFQADFTLERRLGEDPKPGSGRRNDEKYVAGLPEDQARGFVLEALFERVLHDTGWVPPQEEGVRKQLLEWAGVDAKAVRDQVKREMATKAAVATAVEHLGMETTKKRRASKAGKEA